MIIFLATINYKKIPVFQNRLIVIGGFISRSNFSDGVYKVLLIPPYTSKLLSRLPQPIAYHGVEGFNDNIFITSGVAGSTVESVVLYNVNENVCKQMSPLP